MSGDRRDLVVVGAGIVALAAVRELLARRPGLRVTVLEREDGVARHQTGSNSGVVHGGIYYKPGSLKARLCVEGAQKLYAYCDARGIPYERCGKVIVALSERELPGLDELQARGLANGVPGLRRVGPAELAEIEPHAAGVAALHSPTTGIVDFGAVARALAADVQAAGAELRTGCAVTAIAPADGGVRVTTADGEQLRARRGLVCAGAWTDRLARAAGAPADPRIVPFRGAYLRLRPERRALVRSLIYPVPDPALPFLGVHLTKRIDGEVWLGPTALMVGAPDAYNLRRVDPRSVAATLAWPGTWRMMRRHWRAGAGELRLGASRAAFVRACAAYVPELGADDVVAGPAGVRAQAVGRDGALVDDFVVHDVGGVQYVRNAPSPAATSALALAGLLADRVAPALA
ncbi:L-2-hydroxyglutarate dehydrogenase [Baekduia alba]|uniref:L-2-hydroxyglutarate oxidase n=1 Tax=Baekduia alba TaxID=2997333 RepID=UPI00233FCD85|nr:L-2-hydroxyglutarate oxidase [Baekduia alba]WCB96320.1 L-2-hydroxyglutarate dehydrogenase [Baekduia alba]